jgi:hypothetical protein
VRDDHRDQGDADRFMEPDPNVISQLRTARALVSPVDRTGKATFGSRRDSKRGNPLTPKAVLVVQKMQPVLANTDAWIRSTYVA